MLWIVRGPRPCSSRETLLLRRVVGASRTPTSLARLMFSTVGSTLLCGCCSGATAWLMLLMMFAAQD